MPTVNALLAALKPEQYAALQPYLEHMDLACRLVLNEPDEAITHVYFVTSGVVSLVNEPNAGEIVEIATVGNEGMVGVPVILAANAMPSRSLVQIPGSGFRVAVAPFRDFLQRNAEFRDLLLRYALALMNQIAQSTSCNRLHEVQERCARWLLQTHDRVEGNSFKLTQEFLAQMLGCHRPTVSIAAGMLQKAGYISYTRGEITILDREGLEQASCPCYRTITREYEKLLKPQ